MALSALEDMAIRYYLRRIGFRGDHEHETTAIAADEKRLEQIIIDYKNYAKLVD